MYGCIKFILQPWLNFTQHNFSAKLACSMHIYDLFPFIPKNMKHGRHGFVRIQASCYTNPVTFDTQLNCTAINSFGPPGLASVSVHWFIHNCRALTVSDRRCNFSHYSSGSGLLPTPVLCPCLYLAWIYPGESRESNQY